LILPYTSSGFLGSTLATSPLPLLLNDPGPFDPVKFGIGRIAMLLPEEDGLADISGFAAAGFGCAVGAKDL
jgi:hypothetical protein